MDTPTHEIESLRRDLDRLAKSGPAVVELEQAREVLRAAGDVIARGVGMDGDRALTLARLALQRARSAQGGPMAPRGSWQQALQKPPAKVAAPTPPEKRSGLQIDSEIPEAHPAKAAIEASIAGAFAGVKGPWRVAILVQPNAPWWGIRVEGTSICWTGTLEGPDEQSPEFLAGRVREAVQLGLMQAALPRHRGRG